MLNTFQSRLVDSSTDNAFPSRSPDESSSSSLSSNRLSDGQNIITRVQIAVMMCATLACPFSDCKGHTFGNPSTLVASFAGGKPTVSKPEFFPIPSCFAGEHGAEHSHSLKGGVSTQEN